MKQVMGFVCFIGAALFMGTAAAADEKPLDVTKYEFEDANVEGGLPGTNGVQVTVRPRGRERSLIRVRTHFIPEMFKSVESI
jgi:hypothetical protein